MTPFSFCRLFGAFSSSSSPLSVPHCGFSLDLLLLEARWLVVLAEFDLEAERVTGTGEAVDWWLLDRGALLVLVEVEVEAAPGTRSVRNIAGFGLMPSLFLKILFMIIKVVIQRRRKARQVRVRKMQYAIYYSVQLAWDGSRWERSLLRLL